MRVVHTVVAVTIPGCGYTFGTGLQEKGVRTVAVRVVDNQTFRQGLEVPLTDRINEELVKTDLIIASEARADAILKVEITDDQGRSLVSGNRLAPVLEGALVLKVYAQLLDRRPGRPISQRRLVDQAEYRIPIGETLESAELELVSDLARKIVLALETEF